MRRLGFSVQIFKLSGISSERTLQFTSKVVFGEKGVAKVLPLGELSAYETKRLEEVKEQLKGEIETGLTYAKENDLACPEKKVDVEPEKIEA